MLPAASGTDHMTRLPVDVIYPATTLLALPPQVTLWGTGTTPPHHHISRLDPPFLSFIHSRSSVRRPPALSRYLLGAVRIRSRVEADSCHLHAACAPISRHCSVSWNSFCTLSWAAQCQPTHRRSRRPPKPQALRDPPPPRRTRRRRSTPSTSSASSVVALEQARRAGHRRHRETISRARSSTRARSASDRPTRMPWWSR